MKMHIAAPFRIPLALYAKARQIAKREGMTWQAAIRQAIQEWVEKREKTETAEEERCTD
jgi:hypothetical protein